MVCLFFVCQNCCMYYFFNFYKVNFICSLSRWLGKLLLISICSTLFNYFYKIMCPPQKINTRLCNTEFEFTEHDRSVNSKNVISSAQTYANWLPFQKEETKHDIKTHWKFRFHISFHPSVRFYFVFSRKILVITLTFLEYINLF